MRSRSRSGAAPSSYAPDESRASSMAIRVLHVLGGSQFGGAIWVVKSYAEALQEHGCSVTVCTSVDRAADVFRDAGCSIVSVPDMVREINPRRDAVALVRLAKLCRDGRYDVVHTHTSKGGMLDAPGTPCRCPSRSPHGSWICLPRDVSVASTTFYATLERAAALLSDRVITVSDYHRQWALRLHIASARRLVTIHNGISRSRLSVSRSRSNVRNELGFVNGEVVIASVGRLAAQKGLEALVSAMPAILRRDDLVRLLLVGDGPIQQDLLRPRFGMPVSAPSCNFSASGQTSATSSTPRTSLRHLPFEKGCPSPSSRRWRWASRSSRPISAAISSSSMTACRACSFHPDRSRRLPRHLAGRRRPAVRCSPRCHGKGEVRPWFHRAEMKDSVWNLYDELLRKKGLIKE